MKYMDPTISDHHLTSKMKRNDGKLKLFSNIENEAEDINTMSCGKAIQLWKHHGNRPHVLKTAQRKSSKSIKTEISYNHIWNIELMASQIPIIVVTNPEGRHWEPTIYQPEPKKKLYLAPGLYPELAPPTPEELSIIATTPYTPTLPSFLRSVKRKISAMF